MQLYNALYLDDNGNVTVRTSSPAGTAGSAATTTTTTYQYKVINSFTDTNAGSIPVDAKLTNTVTTNITTGAVESSFWYYGITLLESAPNPADITSLSAAQEVSGPSGAELALDSSIQEVISAIHSQTGTTVALDPSGVINNAPSGVTGTLVNIIRDDATNNVKYVLYASNTSYTPIGILEPFIVSYGSSTVISSALPTGASTSALQTTGNTTLQNIANTELEIKINLGAIADSSATSDTGSFSLIALFKRNLEKLTALNSLFPASLGQKNKANSLSVTLASDQNNAVETGGNLAAINSGIQNISGLFTPKADSIYPTFGSTADQYVYKLSGVTVLTRTIDYTDSTKSVISSITQG